MRSVRRLLPIGALLLAPVLAGCGGDDEPSGEDASAAESSSSPAEPSSPASTEATDPATPGVLPAACDVLSPQDVSDAYRVEFGPAELGGGGHTEQDLEWQSDNCSWEAEDLVEVTFALSGPDDFADGTLVCPEPLAIASTVEPVTGLDADAAWWEVDDAPPLEATLRVCTATALFDLELEYEDGVDYQGDPQRQTIALAKAVLVALAG